MGAIPSGNDSICVATRRTTMKAVAATATGAAITLVLGGMTAAPAAASTAGNCGSPSVLGVVTCVYDNPAINYVLLVPAGVTEVHIEGRGAGGGNGGTIDTAQPAPQGGPGGVVEADFPVAAGDVLRILVGGRGKDAKGMKPGAGGLNGGAKGGGGALGGGGGGGASSVRLNGIDPYSRILVAGGGGGAGGAMTSTAVTSASGGAGGGVYGGDGNGDTVGKGGIGATGPSGGAGLRRPTGLDGHSGHNADWGGSGGEGGYGASDTLTLKHAGTWPTGPVGAGGGGGGWGGGGGGAAGPMLGGGGGGGSGMVATSAVAPSVARLGTAQLLNGATGGSEDGHVVVSYKVPIDRNSRSDAWVAPTVSAAVTSNARD